MLAVSVSLIVGLGILVSGCGQQTPSISTSSSQPKALTIRGTVYGSILYWYVDPWNEYWKENRGNPMAGVAISLSGNGVNRTTTTNANGEYSFTDLPQTAGSYGQMMVADVVQNSGYIIVASKEGYQRTIAGTALSSSSGPLPDNTETTLDVDMSSRPVVLSISPAPGSTVEAAPLNITVEFNEAMDPATVRPTLTCKGIRTFAAGDTQNLTCAWSNGNKTLVVTSGALLPNQIYQFMLDPDGTAKDASGIVLDSLLSYDEDDTGSGGLTADNYNGERPDQYYRVAAGGAPGAPTELQLLLNGKLTGLDYQDINYGLATVVLNWITPASGQISGYKVYASRSSAGPWQLIRDASDSNHAMIGDVKTNSLQTEVDDINFSIYGNTLQSGGNYPGGVDPVCIGNAMFINSKAYFRVVAYNADGESSAATAEAQDSTGPILSISSYNGAALTLINGYVLPATVDDTERYIAFREPVNQSDAGTAGNYALDGGLTVSSVQVMTSSDYDIEPIGNEFGGLGAYTVIHIKASGALTGRTLTVSGTRDLAGNAVVTGTGDTLIL